MCRGCAVDFDGDIVRTIQSLCYLFYCIIVEHKDAFTPSVAITGFLYDDDSASTFIDYRLLSGEYSLRF